MKRVKRLKERMTNLDVRVGQLEAYEDLISQRAGEVAHQVEQMEALSDDTQSRLTALRKELEEMDGDRPTH